MLLYAVIAHVFADSIIGAFRDDPEVIKVGSEILKYQSLTFFSHGIIIMANMILQNMGKTIKATVLSVSRQGLFFIPLVIILPQLFGIKGLEVAQAVADGLAFIITIPFIISIIKDMNNDIKKQNEILNKE